MVLFGPFRQIPEENLKYRQQSLISNFFFYSWSISHSLIPRFHCLCLDQFRKIRQNVRIRSSYEVESRTENRMRPNQPRVAHLNTLNRLHSVLRVQNEIFRRIQYRLVSVFVINCCTVWGHLYNISPRSTILSLKFSSSPPPQCGVDLKRRKSSAGSLPLQQKVCAYSGRPKNARLISYFTENAVPVMKSNYGQTPYR